MQGVSCADAQLVCLLGVSKRHKSTALHTGQPAREPFGSGSVVLLTRNTDAEALLVVLDA